MCLAVWEPTGLRSYGAPMQKIHSNFHQLYLSSLLPLYEFIEPLWSVATEGTDDHAPEMSCTIIWFEEPIGLDRRWQRGDKSTMWPIRWDGMKPYLWKTFYLASYNNSRADYLCNQMAFITHHNPDLWAPVRSFGHCKLALLAFIKLQKWYTEQLIQCLLANNSLDVASLSPLGLLLFQRNVLTLFFFSFYLLCQLLCFRHSLLHHHVSRCCLLRDFLFHLETFPSSHRTKHEGLLLHQYVHLNQSRRKRLHLLGSPQLRLRAYEHTPCFPISLGTDIFLHFLNSPLVWLPNIASVPLG